MYLGNGKSMDHIITSVDHIQAGDVLKLRSNVGVTLEKPNGRRQHINIDAYIPTQNHSARPDPEVLMRNPELKQTVRFAVPTNTGSIRVIAMTRHYIMVDFQHWYGRDTVQWSNVMIPRQNFEVLFLQQSRCSCYKKTIANPRYAEAHSSSEEDDVFENPPAPTAPTAGEEARNPPARMAQANSYLITAVGRLPNFEKDRELYADQLEDVLLAGPILRLLVRTVEHLLRTSKKKR